MPPADDTGVAQIYVVEIADPSRIAPFVRITLTGTTDQN
jgi:hypothetical protein